MKFNRVETNDPKLGEWGKVNEVFDAYVAGHPVDECPDRATLILCRGGLCGQMRITTVNHTGSPCDNFLDM